MSYGLAFTGDARADLRDLDPWIQEDVLDELERLASDPSLVRRRRPGAPSVHDFVRSRGGIRHYVFLTVYRDDAARTIQLLGIAQFEGVGPS